MTDHILVPIANGTVLALTIETFQEALKRGSELIPQTRVKREDDEKPIWLPVREVARLCNISETFLYGEIKLDHIPSRRFGSGVRIRREYVEHQTGDLMSNGDNDD